MIFKGTFPNYTQYLNVFDMVGLDKEERSGGTVDWAFM
jgi:hypothetical protein